MTPHSSRPPRRKSLFAYIYDWANGSDLNHFEAYMLALFVFLVGLGILGSTFILGKLESLAHRHRAFASRQQFYYDSRPYVQLNTRMLPVRRPAPGVLEARSPLAYYQPTPQVMEAKFPPIGAASIARLFGRPRSQNAFNFVPPGFGHAGQAEAATGSWQ